MALSLVAATGFTPGAQAASLLDPGMGAAGFSSGWTAPTPVSPGVDRIEGTGRLGSNDDLLFGALPRGVHALALEVSAPPAVGESVAPGGVVPLDSEPSAHAWAGIHAGDIRFDQDAPGQSVMSDLAASFADDLRLAHDFMHGSEIAHTILAETTAFPNASGDGEDEAEPTPVPLPSSGFMLGVLFGVLALLVAPRHRRTG